MADYSEAASNAEQALEDTLSRGVKSYDVNSKGRSAEFFNPVDLIKATAMANGLNARTSIFRLAKRKNPRK